MISSRGLAVEEREECVFEAQEDGRAIVVEVTDADSISIGT